MERDDFLARIRQASAAGRPYRVHVRDKFPDHVGYEGAGPDPAARLADEINAVGGKACIVAGRRAAQDELTKLIEQYQIRRAITWQHPLLDELELVKLLEAQQVAAVDYRQLSQLPAERQRESMLAADLGITSVWRAVAETGTLALCSGPGRERTASLLPPVHVAIVERSQILPDLFDLFAELEAEFQGELPSNLVLITGPSKTGDLELKLTTGVHGPGNWHVIVIDSAAAR